MEASRLSPSKSPSASVSTVSVELFDSVESELSVELVDSVESALSVVSRFWEFHHCSP